MFFAAVCALMLFVAEASAQTAQGDASMRFGIVPFGSPAAIFRVHRPLSHYLSERLHRPIRFYTATDHKKFYWDAVSGMYDLMIVSPHFVPLLMKQGFVPLKRYRSEVDVLLAVRADQPFRTLDDLRGKRIGFPDTLAFIAVNARLWFERQGIQVDQYFQIQAQPSIASAVLAVDLGKLDAAVAAETVFNQFPPSVRARLKTIKLTQEPQPSLVFMAKESLGQKSLDNIRAALESFPATAGGKIFFRESGYQGFVPVTQESLEALSVYTTITERLLERH